MRWLVPVVLIAAGCGQTLAPGKVTVVANGPNNQFLWLAREVVVADGLFSKRQHTVVFLCERTQDHPQCYAAEFHPSKRTDMFWPDGMPCPPDGNCRSSKYTLRRAASKPSDGGPAKTPTWSKEPTKPGARDQNSKDPLWTYP